MTRPTEAEIAELLRELANIAMLSEMLIGEEYADRARAMAARLGPQP